jgi:DNA-binding transcriptional LysR family regulator
MRQQNVLSLNFFLLKCLVALVEHSHVTRAADALSMSQPAMSRAMSQLRQLTGDPILVKAQNGLVPTAKAFQLREFAVRILKEMDELLGHAIAFEPVSVRRSFRIVATDYLESVFLDRVANRLTKEFPTIAVSVQHPINPKELFKVLESGDVDFCIGMLPPTLEDLRHRLIFQDSVVCIAAASHPAAGKTLSLAEFAALDHVVIRPTVHAFAASFDQMLEANGLVRNQRVITPNYLSVPYLVEGSSMVALVPQTLAAEFCKRYDLSELEMPLDMPPYDVYLYWHERSHHHLDHVWFRAQVAQGL